MDRPVVGITAPYRKSDYTYKDMLLDRIKDLEALVAKLEQRIKVLEGKRKLPRLPEMFLGVAIPASRSQQLIRARF